MIIDYSIIKMCINIFVKYCFLPIALRDILIFHVFKYVGIPEADFSWMMEIEVLLLLRKYSFLIYC